MADRLRPLAVRWSTLLHGDLVEGSSLAPQPGAGGHRPLDDVDQLDVSDAGVCTRPSGG
jgi:hypothetical protein